MKVVGFIGGAVTWLTLAQKFSGAVTISTVGDLDPCLHGYIAGITISALVTIVISIFKPEN